MGCPALPVDTRRAYCRRRLAKACGARGVRASRESQAQRKLSTVSACREVSRGWDRGEDEVRRADCEPGVVREDLPRRQVVRGRAVWLGGGAAVLFHRPAGLSVQRCTAGSAVGHGAAELPAAGCGQARLAVRKVCLVGWPEAGAKGLELIGGLRAHRHVKAAHSGSEQQHASQCIANTAQTVYMCADGRSQCSTPRGSACTHRV